MRQIQNPLEKKAREVYIPQTQKEFEDVVRLRETEVERWIPFIGSYRLIKDTWNRDFETLNKIHSKAYQWSNAVYNVLTPGGAILGLGLLIDKLM